MSEEKSKVLKLLEVQIRAKREIANNFISTEFTKKECADDIAELEEAIHILSQYAEGEKERDSCEKCRYEFQDKWADPCMQCKRAAPDNYEPVN